MREITDHAGNGLNDALKITVLDKPGQGGACHKYQITAGEDNAVLGEINFQNGPIKEFGVNGISNEALLAIVADRLTSFQNGPFACGSNKIALDHVWDALTTLKERTAERTARGVEGTNQK